MNITRHFFLIFPLFAWILSDGQANHQTETKEILWTVAWSPDGKHLAVGGNLEEIAIYDGKTLDKIKSYPMLKTVTRIKWHPTKQLMAIATQSSVDISRIIDIEKDIMIELTGISKEGARGMDWNHSGEYLAVGDNDGKISIYRADGKLLNQIQQDNGKGIMSLAWHPAKDIFITVGEKIRIYHIDGELLHEAPHRKEETLLLSVAWHPSGQFFVTGDYGDFIKNYSPLLQIWNADAELIRSMDNSIGEYRNVAWNTDGTLMATASDMMRLWDAEGNLKFEGKSNEYLWGIDWDDTNQKIVTSSTDQQVVLYNVSGEIIGKIE